MRLAPYAVLSAKSCGRIHKEGVEDENNRFAVDRHRIVHSAAFRRLEYKTQVLVNHAGDHYRTRLTHSLEVSQVARNIARRLNLNEDLAEVIALSHDLGHPPFGHAGEEGLCVAAKNYGGFDHNLHAVKIVTKLEDGYVNFPGLNLTGETLEGIIKHNGPIAASEANISVETLNLLKMKLNSYPSLEAQVASLADDIAYCNHDLDDAIRAKFISVAEVIELPKVGDVFIQVKKDYPGIGKQKLTKEAIRRLSVMMIDDLVNNSISLLSSRKIQTLADVAAAEEYLICFSAEWEEIKNLMKRFLFKKYYRHYQINRMTSKAKHVMKAMFDEFYQHPESLPTKWYNKCQKAEAQKKAEIIMDYIAGMTDRYAIAEYGNLFDPKLF